MKTAGAIASLFWILIIPFFPSIAAQQAPNRTPLDQSRPVPEMERLAKALVGDWNTMETMERGEFLPNGGSRHGVVHVRPAAGGTTLIYESTQMVLLENSMACSSSGGTKRQVFTVCLSASTILVIPARCAETRVGKVTRL
jgi:hypothetical protein